MGVSWTQGLCRVRMCSCTGISLQAVPQGSCHPFFPWDHCDPRHCQPRHRLLPQRWEDGAWDPSPKQQKSLFSRETPGDRMLDVPEHSSSQEMDTNRA